VLGVKPIHLRFSFWVRGQGISRSIEKPVAVSLVAIRDHGLRQRTDITDEIRERLATDLTSDPRKDTIIALDLGYQVRVKQPPASNRGTSTDLC
jgi:hypothetical protein